MPSAPAAPSTPLTPPTVPMPSTLTPSALTPSAPMPSVLMPSLPTSFTPAPSPHQCSLLILMKFAWVSPLVQLAFCHHQSMSWDALTIPLGWCQLLTWLDSHTYHAIVQTSCSTSRSPWFIVDFCIPSFWVEAPYTYPTQFPNRLGSSSPLSVSWVEMHLTNLHGGSGICKWQRVPFSLFNVVGEHSSTTY
jgi:hypothetical protein